MKIAVTYENGNIFQHFGRSEAFKFYTIENGQVTNEEVISTNGQGHGALSGFLTANGANVVICGGIGPGAQEALAEAGIQLFAGAAGSTDEAVKACLAGTLPASGEANCNHDHGHGHEHGHSCGGHNHEHGHSCGGHHE